MVYFSDIFNVDESILESYGAMNISLLNDIPLFIDPFLLYASEKPEYRQLHENILDYLSFLRDKASGFISSEKIKRWYTFPEVKQNWLGYSESGNGGLGLGKDFGQSMSKAIQGVFPDLKNEKITETSHLEKLSLFKVGVDLDNISKIKKKIKKKYLLEYTQTFAMQYLSLEQCKNIAVSKVYFDYKYENWMSQKYILPYFNGDYVILTPKDLLTKDETWINASEMRHRLLDITSSLPNDELRDQINDIYLKQLTKKKITNKLMNEAAATTIARFPILMDYYIKIKEEEKENAKKVIIFTDKGIRSTGLLDLLTDILEENKTEYQVFDDLACEPSYQDVEKVMKEVENTSGDLIIAIGGGSVMDAAKLCCVLKDADYTIKDLLNDPMLAKKQIGRAHV